MSQVPEIAVLLSGGVDSSVAMARLLRQGHPKESIKAYYLKIWLEDELRYLGDCPWQEDLSYASAVCEQLGVSLEVVPLQGAYQSRVVEYTLAELRAGRTPSPDIFCNQQIKFGAFLEWLPSAEVRVASGHYARLLTDAKGDQRLYLAKDRFKDQTYFLSQMSPSQLNRSIFPLGDLLKSEVRALAKEYQLPTQERADSQGICFLGKIKYDEFVEFHLGKRPGAIVEQHSGKVLGVHQGYWFHTIGQRKGLGLGGGPWFVAAKDVDENIIYVVHERDDAWLEQRHFQLAMCNWYEQPESPMSVEVKLRHGPKLYGAEIKQGEQGWQVALQQPDRGLAPGQFAVVYDNERVLGSGMIAPLGSAQHQQGM